MNSAFVTERARNLARSLLSDRRLTDGRRLERAYLRILQRRPAPEEFDGGYRYLESFQRTFGASALDAWESLCRALISSNEFIYVD